jgi:glutathionylspermidine synthase
MVIYKRVLAENADDFCKYSTFLIENFGIIYENALLKDIYLHFILSQGGILNEITITILRPLPLAGSAGFGFSRR